MLILKASLAGGYGASPTAGPHDESELIVGTFNIHYLSPRQNRMLWDDRRDAVVEALRLGDADVIGFQEMETFVGGHWNRENRQLEWVLRHFPDYAVTAYGDPRLYPSTQPILYRKDRFEALEQGFFFFSPTPERIYSRPWHGRFPAFCSWSRLYDRTADRSFYLYNLHFDHSSLRNRLRSARLVAERIAAREHKEDGVIVLGDFNAPRLFRPVRIVAENNLTVAPSRGSTFHFNRGINLLPAIDHVLFSAEFGHRSTAPIRGRFKASWPSDHYPVFVTLGFLNDRDTSR